VLELTGNDLERSAGSLLAQGREAFGFGRDTVDRVLPRLISREGHDRLFAEMERTLGAGYFSIRRAIFEAGCGTGSFVIPALDRGHDAYGVDNDPSRLAVANAKVSAYALPPEWTERMRLCDAMDTGFEANRFDVVLGHQFIEHVPDPAGIASELLRITKPGGFIVLYAPDYRAPFEAHYEIPWPPFAARWMLEAWLDAFERPYGGLAQIFPVTLFQLHGIFQALDCDIVAAGNDFPIEERIGRHFDLSSPAAVRATAMRMRNALSLGTLPRNFTMPTSLVIAVRKR
jgi:SAM-dependent methyltransferase